jgi:hypothetical protein
MVVPRFPSGHLAFMSRAFVNEDASSPPDPEYRLPDPASPYYLEAAAWALIEGADQGDTRGAEDATGYKWGSSELIAHMEEILGKAEAEGGDRVAQLARRYLRPARQDD